MEAYQTPSASVPSGHSYDSMKTIAQAPVSPRQDFIGKVLNGLDEFDEPTASDIITEIRSGYAKRLDGRIRDNNERRQSIDERNSMLEAVIKRTVSPL